MFSINASTFSLGTGYIRQSTCHILIENMVCNEKVKRNDTRQDYRIAKDGK